MSIEVEFTAHNTIRITCGGEVAEVPLPAARRGGAPTGRAPAGHPRPPSQVPDPIPGPTQTVLPREPDKEPYGRPKNEPGVAIITDSRSGDLPQDLFIPDPLLEPPLQLEMLQALSVTELRDRIAGLQRGGVPLTGAPFFLDLGVAGGLTAQKRVHLADLQSLIRERYLGLTGIRLLRMPDDE